jgi:N-acetyl-anhydromuramyl-L-alanine amidase AmpD
MSRPAFAPDSSVVAEVTPSPNHNERSDGRRADLILLHYTGMADAESALALLCADGSKVSSHYFVFEDGRIVQMVPESRRAWHAGISEWAEKQTSIRARSGSKSPIPVTITVIPIFLPARSPR